MKTGSDMALDLRPSALFLTPEPPFPQAGGGALRTAALLHYLAMHYIVDVVVFRQPGEPDPSAAFPAGLARDIRVIELPYHSRGLAARATRNLGRFVGNRPPLNDRFSGFGPQIKRFLSGRKYDLAVVEHFWCAAYHFELAEHAGRTVLDLHNIESALYASLAACERWPASVVLRRFGTACRALEQQWLPRFSLVLAASAADEERVRDICPAARTKVHPNTIPLTPRPEVPEQLEIVFSGNMEYRPNTTAVRFFRKRIWPALRRRYPKLIWRLVGRNPQAVARCVAGDERIELVGPVDDAVKTLASAHVAVVPLLAGSGTRLKILEAWAAGRAVVSTQLGAEGLPANDGEHLLIADTAEAFAAAVARLIDTPDERRRLGLAGRALYEAAFTSEHGWQNLAKIGI